MNNNEVEEKNETEFVCLTFLAWPALIRGDAHWIRRIRWLRFVAEYQDTYQKIRWVPAGRTGPMREYIGTTIKSNQTSYFISQEEHLFNLLKDNK